MAPKKIVLNVRSIIAGIVSFALVAQPMSSLAQVVAAPGAPTGSKPLVTATANGTPLVQIATPNAAGVSMNQYSSYNVSNQGLILNNAQANTLTQQGGYVGANPYLAAGSARIIVNQVVSGSASQLLGYTEVAGARSEVVIANPAGIYCNGCGFINTSRGVLTTGAPVYGGSGSLDAFHVTGGQIQIGSAGMNASNVDQVDLIARSVQVNGKLWAGRQLNVVTGANDVAYADLSTHALAPDGNAPGVAIDVAQLGGMYANKIMLIGTEAGVGVNSQGTIAAQAGDFTLSSKGLVTLGGSTSASGNVQIDSAGDIANAGSVYAGQNAAIAAQGQVGNSGTIAALGNLNVSGGTVSSSGVLGAGIDTGGNATGNGDLTVNGTGVVVATGQNLAGGNATFNGSSVNLAGAHTTVAGTLALAASGAVVNDQGQVSASQLTINAASLSNHGGNLTQIGIADTALTIAAGLDNTNGAITSNALNMNIRSGSLINQGGQINHAGTGALALYTGTLTNNSGIIATNGHSTITASNATNASGAINAADAIGIDVTGLLDNSGGTLSTAGALIANAASLKNAQGNISGATVALTIPQLDNSGGRITANQLNLNATNLTNQGGALTQFGTGAMTLAVSNALDNSNGGLIQTNSQDLTLTPASLNNNGGTITHAGTGVFTIAPGNGTGTLTNVGGTLASNGSIALSASSLDNTDGTVSAQGDVTAGTTGTLNNTRGTLRSIASLSATSGSALNNTGGKINAGGAAAANNNSTLNLSAASIDNTGGSINNLGAGATTVSGTTQIVNSNAVQATGMGSISGNGAVTLATSSLSNTQGGQVSGANLQINANSIDNSGGRIGNTPNATGNVGISTSGAVTNAGGQIGAAQNLRIAARTLLGAGAFTAAGDVILNLQGDFNNAAGNQISAANNLTFTLPGNLTNAGSLLAVNELNVSAANVNNSGSMAAGGLLSTNSATLTNTGTIIGASVSLAASQSITNAGTTALIGATDSAGTLELLAPDIENRDDTTATDTQAQTAIYGLGKVVLAGGKDAGGNYTSANLVNNQSALIQSAGDLLIQSTLLKNTRRTLTTSGNFSAAVDPSLLTSLGISLSGTVGEIDVHDPNSIGGVYIEPPHGGALNSDYLYTTYSADAIVANQMLTISPKAQIISGGNMIATVGTLQNYWSQVAAIGNIALTGTLDQNSWQGQTAPQVQVQYSGTYLYRTYDNKLWTMSFCASGCDTSEDVRTYALPSYDSSFTANGALTGNGVTINNTAGNASITPLGLAAGQTLPSVNPTPVNGGINGAGNPILAKATALNVLNNITLPQGGLFKTNTAPGATYLIETNPAFANLQQWLSSDFYFQQMGVNPAQIHERLGDGYYEQQLVQNQILSLTGKAVLSNYANTQAEFQAMMTSGAALAQSLNLTVGMALSAEQVAKLTSDVVIMQDQVVDGKTVLVPVVYLAQASQQNSNGPVIAANTIDLTNTQGFTNSGTVKADGALTVTGQSIDNQNGALQSGGLMSLATVGDVNLTSANVNAGSLQLEAGGNLLLSTETKTVNQINDNGATRTTTTLGPTASLNVKGDAQISTGGNFEQNAGNLAVGGNLTASVGGSWLIGAQQTGETQTVARYGGVSNTSTNQVTGSNVLVGGTSNINVGADLIASGAQINLIGGGNIAANNVELLSSKATSTVDSTSAGSSGNHSYSEHLNTLDDITTGTNLQSGQSLNVTARAGDITLSGSTIQLAQGTAALTATGDVNVVAATEEHSSTLDETHGYTALGSGKETSNHRAAQAEFSYGSTISADAITINSGKDITVNGSNVVGTNDVTLAAAGKVTINTSQDTQSSQTASHTHEYGMLSGSGVLNTLDGGLQGVSNGVRSATDGQQNTQVMNNGSMVGSVNGNLTVMAGDAVHVTGSTVYAGNDATFSGKSVVFDSAFNTVTQNQQQSVSQTAISGGLTSPILTAIQTVQAMEKAGKDSGDTRLQAMAAATSAMAVANAYTAVSNAALGSAVGVSISLGSSHSSSESSSTLSQAVGSSASAGNNLTIVAAGAGANSNIDVIGSGLSAGNNTTIAADGAVNLLAAKNETTQKNSGDGSSASIGVTFGIGGSNGVSFQLGVSANKGEGSGNDVVYTNTQVSGGNKVSVSSGGDANLIGAVVTAPQVVADVGGNLNIQSLQDTSVFDSKQTSAGIGVSLCIPPICYGSSSVSGNFSNASVNGDYASVTTQSGIQAGDQGFQVAVAGNTNLTGAVIASSAQAIVDDKNTLTTGTLTQSALQNKDTFDASGFSISGSVSGKVGDQATAPKGSPQEKAAQAPSTPTGSSGFSSDSGSQASTTQSGISGGVVTITNNAGQIAATGQTADQTVASLNRNIVTGADTSSALTKAWNGDQLMQKTQAAVRISAAFGSAAAKAVGDYAQSKYNEALKNGDMQAAAEWGEGGSSRVVLQTAAGALGGGLNGALGAAASSSLMPIIGGMIDKMDVPDSVKQALGMVAASAIGTIAGGEAGLAGGFNVDVNNRQLHMSTYNRLLSGCAGSNSTECQTIIKMAGVRSGMPTDYSSIPASKVVANYDANNNIVSYTLIDRSTNQPTMILEPLEFAAYQTFSPGTQAMMQLSPQYALDFASAGLYGASGDSNKALSSVIAGVTSRDYLRDAVLGLLGVAGGVAAGAAVDESAPQRTLGGVPLDPRLPDPIAGLDYQPSILNSSNPNIANSQLNGYIGELNLANTIAEIPNQAVVSYGGAVGTHGADVVSVDTASGNVVLWDNKYRSTSQTIPPSPTFTPESNALNNALSEAQAAIENSNLPASTKQQALQNLQQGNFTANTVGSGAAKNSVTVKFCSGKPC